MALEKIGVQAVVQDIGNYLSDINKLNKATDSTSTSIDKASKSSEAMSKALRGIGSVVAGLGLTALFGKMVQSAGESESAVAALNAVIKSTGGVAGVTAKAAEDLASSLQATTRFSDETILSGESMLLTFTKIGKDVFPRATKAVLDYAQKFGSVEAASIAIGKALQDPISGVTNLRRVGVMLSKQQEQQIKDFMAVGNVAGAQNIILKELETEFGGLAVAAGKTFPGKLDILKNKFDDILEVAGGKLIPELSDLLDVVGKFIDQLGPDNTANILLFAGAIGAIAIAAGPVGAALAIILSPIGLIIAGVVALAAAFNSNFLGIRDLIMTVWNAIKGPIEAIGKDISKIFTGLTQGFDVSGAFADLGFQIKHGLEIALSSAGIDSRIVQKVIDAFSSIQTYVANVLWPALMNFFGWLGGIWNIVSPAFTNLVNWFTQTAIPGVLDFITGTVIPGVQDFIDTLIRIWNDVSPYLTDLFNWFVNDALPTIGGVLNDFRINVVQPVIDILASLWGNLVKPALENLYNWFVNDGMPKIKEIAKDLWENVLKKLVELLEGIWQKVRPGLEGLAKWFQDNGPLISQVISNTIIQTLNTLLTVIKDIIRFADDAIAKVQELLKTGGAYPGVQQNAAVVQKGLASGQFSIGQVITSALNAISSELFHDYAGPYSANQPYLVGKGAQPELFVPNSSGFAFPNADSLMSGLMAQASPAYAPASSYAYNTYNNQQSMGDIMFNGVQGTDDAMRRYALLRAMGRVR